MRSKTTVTLSKDTKLKATEMTLMNQINAMRWGKDKERETMVYLDLESTEEVFEVNFLNVLGGFFGNRRGY